MIAQRLVRTVCAVCDDMSGCTACRFSGYSGRSVIAEAYEVDEGLRRLLSRRASVQELAQYLYEHGFRNLSEDGAEKVEWGVTTKEEVLRVLSE